MSFFVRAFGGIALLAALLLLKGPVNALLRPVFDVILMPFRGMHPLVGLLVLAVPASIGAMIAFRETSDQDALARIKDKIFAGLFEIRLFNDDLKAVFKAQGEVLSSNAKYFGQAMVPLVWMIGPFIFLTTQLQFHYGYEGLQPGDETLVRVELAEGWQDRVGGSGTRPDVSLEVPAGLELRTPAVWTPSRNEMFWRVGAAQEGDYEMQVRVGGESYSKSLTVSDQRTRRSPLRVMGGLMKFDELLYPAESPLPAKGLLSAIEVEYREAGMTLGLANWVWAFFGLTIVIGFAFKDKLGVTI